MDATTPTTPPPPPPPPAVGSTRLPRWRRPLADLADLVVLALAAAAAGAAVAGLLMLDAGDDPWAGLAAALLGLNAAGVTLLVLWIVLLVRVRTGRTTPGHRLLGCRVDRTALVVAGSHAALVVAGWGLVVTLAALTEPPPEGPVAAALGAGLAATALVLAHGWGPTSTRVGIVAGALVVGGALAGAVPDRAPYDWEVREVVHEAVVAELERYDVRPDADRAPVCW